MYVRDVRIYFLDLLQWGRGLLTADVFGVGDGFGYGFGLQWGRGLLTADVRIRCTVTSRSFSFNGAAVC